MTPAQQAIGKAVMILGIALILGGFMYSKGWLSWLGRLPGDIRVEGDSGGFYFPITTCIVLSVLGTIIFQLIGRFRG